MPINDQATIFRASFVLPIDSPVISNGAVKVKGNRIVAVSKFADIPKSSRDKIISLPGCVIMPGFVNAHTHLELTCLKGITKERSSFSKWILEVVKAKRELCEKDYEESIKQGISESIKGGITTFGDITGTGLSPKIMEDSGVRGIAFHEVIGFKKKDSKKIFSALCKKIAAFKTLFSGKNGLIKIGISPHSPYSVSPELFKLLCGFAKRLKLPLSIHLAETKEEIEFLKNGKGPLKELLLNLNSFEKAWEAPSCSPLKYLNSLNILSSKTSIVHFNYFDEEDIQIVKKSRIKIIHCPKSNNRWFRRKGSPVIECLEKSIPASIGTDSLASNDCYNMFDEMRVLRSFYPQLKAEKILKIATLGGAFCLGLDKKIGSLRSGKLADFIAIKIPEKIKPEDIAEYLVSGKNEICLSVINGKLIYDLLSLQ